jgi:hypothetical protein
MNATLFSRTQKRKQFLKSFLPDFEIIEIWEHDWDKMCKDNSDLIEFLKGYDFEENLEPRDCLYGGRTNALKLYYNCSKGERIFYYDFCSLYPAVMKYEPYPIGHPIIISENFSYDKEYFGVIKCTILPPRKLYIPVLPLNINKKLVFTLCYKCAFEQLNDPECSHTDEERSLKGTWVSLEINKAIKLGYKLIKYHQIWNFEEKSQYDPIAKTGGLFTDYVNFNLKGKTEASGFPADCPSDILKDEFIKEFENKEGVKLDKANIAKNPGVRNEKKAKLNCLWGFFALASDHTMFKIIYKKEELDHLLSNDQFIIQNIDFCDDDFIQVSYSIREEFSFGSSNTNVIIAAFTTCHARLKLYSELERLGENVIYFDTGWL